MRVVGRIENNPPGKSLSSFKFRFTRKTGWVKFSPFRLGCGLKKTEPELAMRKVNQAGGRVTVGTMDRRTVGFSIAFSPTHPESLRWFALGFSAALNFTTRVSISMAPRLNQSDPDAVAPVGSIFADSHGGKITGADKVDRTLARAIPWFETCSSGRWAVVALDHSHVAGSKPAPVSPTMLGTLADELEKAKGRQIVAK